MCYLVNNHAMYRIIKRDVGGELELNNKKKRLFKK